jgi:hypothetical protein
MDRNSIIPAAYAMLRNHFSSDIKSDIAALKLLCACDVDNLQTIVDVYNYHIENASADLSASQKELATLTLLSIKDRGAAAIEQYYWIVVMLLNSPDELLVNDALRVSYIHCTPKIALTTFCVVYSNLFAMLKEGHFDNGNSILSTGLEVLNSVESKDHFWGLLVDAFNNSDSRATAGIMFAMIKWGEHHSDLVNPLLTKWMDTETDSLIPAIALCLLGDIRGLRVILAHLVEPKSSLKVASWPKITANFSEENVVSQIVDLIIAEEDLEPSALLQLEIERSCFYERNEEIEQVIVRAINSKRSEVRMYGVQRVLYCLSPESDWLMAQLLRISDCDPSPDVRVAAIEVIVGYTNTLPPEDRPVWVDMMLLGYIRLEPQSGIVRTAAAQALAGIVADRARSNKLLNS